VTYALLIQHLKMTTMAFYIDDSHLIGLGEVFHVTENVFVLRNTLITTGLIYVD
jgi:hypothetical protein